MDKTNYPNRAARRRAGFRGAHRHAGSRNFRRAGVGALMVMASTGMVAGLANADPILNPAPPSVSNPAAPTINPTAPAVPEVAPSNQGAGVIPDPPSTQWRPNPNSEGAAAGWGGQEQDWGAGTQAPTILDTVFAKPAPPMILPEPGVIRIGSFQTVKPAWVTMAEMNSINRWAAYTESRIAQFWLSQGFSEEEADRRAASMFVGGAVGGLSGGAAGFALGAIPGVLIGAPAGALIGAGAGALGAGAAVGAGLIPLNFAGPAGTGIWFNAIGAAALAGAAAGAAVGIPVGAVVGGAIGGTIVGIPGAAIGVGLGSLLGGGDPNQKIDQPWLYRNGQGQITPKANKLEFDWEGTKAIPELSNVPEAHVNFQVKDDDTWVVKLGDERWLGATQQERDVHFYGEIDKLSDNISPDIKAGQIVRGVLEDENGVFQNTIRDFLAKTAKDDPTNTQYNPGGDIADPSRRAERVHYGYTSTPDRWDEPRYLDGEDPKAVGGAENALVTPDQPPVTDEGTASEGPIVPAPEADPAPSAPAPAPVPAPTEPGVFQISAPAATPAVAPVAVSTPAPAPVVNTGNVAIDKAAADIQNAVANIIPGVAHA